MRCCWSRMGQSQILSGGIQHCCRRRRMVSMVGVCATTCFLSLLYFYYGPLSSLPYAASPSGVPGSVHPDSPNDRLGENQGWGQSQDGTGVTTFTRDSKSYTYDTDENLYDHYDNKAKANTLPNRTLKASGDGVVQGKGFPKPIYIPLKRFVKERTDLLSVKGDDSDYLFPACQEDATFQANDTYGFLGPFRYLANYKNPCWMEQGIGDIPAVYCVPYFYLVGAPKAGSTDVYKRITMHPEVVKPASKETRWFDRKRFLEKPHFSSFLSNFYLASGVISRSLEKGSNYHRRIVGDGSPSYFFDNRNWPLLPGNEGCEEPRVTVASHIHHLFPKARILFVLRNPVDRLYSSYLYNHAKYEAVSSRTFDMYVREAIKIYQDCFAQYSVRICANNATVFQQAKVMLVVSLYSVFVQDWMELFPRQQLLFLTTEQYNLNMSKHLGKVYGFLGLRPLTRGEMETITMHSPYNKGQHYSKTGPMLKETREMLEDFYRPYNRQLANMLNDPEFLWMS